MFHFQIKSTHSNHPKITHSSLNAHSLPQKKTHTKKVHNPCIGIIVCARSVTGAPLARRHGRRTRRATETQPRAAAPERAGRRHSPARSVRMIRHHLKVVYWRAAPPARPARPRPAHAPVAPRTPWGVRRCVRFRRQIWNFARARRGSFRCAFRCGCVLVGVVNDFRGKVVFRCAQCGYYELRRAAVV